MGPSPSTRSMRTPPSGDASSEAPEREREAPLSTSRAPAPVREARVARVPADLAPVREARVARVPADLAPAPVREREDGNRLLRIKKSPDTFVNQPHVAEERC